MNLSNIELPSNKKFGFFFSIVFLIIALYFYFFSNLTSSMPYFVVSISLLAITLINANLLLPFNKLWMRFGLLLGMIVSPLVLGIIFYLLITPLSIFLRIFGRDELNLNPKQYSSYWIHRESTIKLNEGFKNQF